MIFLCSEQNSEKTKALLAGGDTHTCRWLATNVPHAVFGRALVSHGMCFLRWPAVQAQRSKTSLSSSTRKHGHRWGKGPRTGSLGYLQNSSPPTCPLGMMGTGTLLCKESGGCESGWA